MRRTVSSDLGNVTLGLLPQGNDLGWWHGMVRAGMGNRDRTGFRGCWLHKALRSIVLATSLEAHDLGCT